MAVADQVESTSNEKLVAAALLLAERYARKTLKSAVKKAIEAVLPIFDHYTEKSDRVQFSSELLQAGRHISKQLEDAILRAREEARRIGRDRLIKDAASLNYIVFDDFGKSLDADAEDTSRTEFAARSLARQWIALAFLYTGRKRIKTIQQELRDTIAKMESRVLRTAETESSHAFNAERTEIASKISYGRIDTDEGSALFGSIATKTWNAILDSATCQECADLDGTTISLNNSFPSGDPPLHYRCRCNFTISLG